MTKTTLNTSISAAAKLHAVVVGLVSKTLKASKAKGLQGPAAPIDL